MSYQPKVPGENESAWGKLGAFLALIVFALGVGALLTVPHPITQLAAALLAPESGKPAEGE